MTSLEAFCSFPEASNSHTFQRTLLLILTDLLCCAGILCWSQNLKNADMKMMCIFMMMSMTICMHILWVMIDNYRSLYVFLIQLCIKTPAIAEMARNGQNGQNLTKMPIFGSINGQHDPRNTNSKYTNPERPKMAKKSKKFQKLPKIVKNGNFGSWSGLNDLKKKMLSPSFHHFEQHLFDDMS